MDYQVAIPTYKRPDVILKTLEMFKDIPKDRIHILFATEAERESYALPAQYNQLVTVPGLVASRTKAQNEYFADGDKVVWCNDDVRGIKQKFENREVAADVRDVIEQGFGVGTELWGVYPIDNGMFMRNVVRTELCHIVGCFYGAINRRNADHTKVIHGDFKEDYERSIRFYRAFGYNARLDFFAPVTTYYNKKGGYAGIRTYEATVSNVAGLIGEFPCNVRLRTEKGSSGYPEIKIGIFC